MGGAGDNVFIRRQGHFSVALGLLSDPEPIDRLLAIIDEAGALTEYGVAGRRLLHEPPDRPPQSAG